MTYSAASRLDETLSYINLGRWRLLVKNLHQKVSGGASIVKEPGHFEVRKSSSQVIRSQGRSQDFLWGALFSSRKFLVVALKTQATYAADCFTVKIKQIKRSDMVTFLFLFTLLPKQSNRQNGARAVDLTAGSFDLARLGVAPPLQKVSQKCESNTDRNKTYYLYLFVIY